MSISRTIKSFVVFMFLAVFAVVGVGQASAAQIDYSNPSNQAIKNPRFNGYTNVPAVGNEADFVRLRNSTGDPTVTATQSNFTDPLNDDCKVGDKYDIRTYVHNIANTEYNNNGSGSAVAHNVKVQMQAPLNTTGNKFDFRSQVSSSNAATVVDTGRLNCGQEVQLKLVPQTVKVYSKHYGWKGASDGAVNGSLTIGSRAMGSGDVWGCWDDRVIIIYVVEVVKKPQVVSKATCDALALTVLDDRKVRARVVASAQNATIIGYQINWGDNTSSNSQTAEHTYTAAGEYTITGRVQVRFANGTTEWITGYQCQDKVTFKEEFKNCPLPGKEHLPVDSPECKEDEKCPIPGKEHLPVDSDECVAPQVKAGTIPTVLPATGPAGIAGVFAATSAAGTIAYNLVYRKFYS